MTVSMEVFQGLSDTNKRRAQKENWYNYSRREERVRYNTGTIQQLLGSRRRCESDNGNRVTVC